MAHSSNINEGNGSHMSQRDYADMCLMLEQKYLEENRGRVKAEKNAETMARDIERLLGENRMLKALIAACRCGK